ncbi:transmembrane protein 120a-like [Plakobranchus ocellatus]|uniref:Transmembrane protein 120a-like n=1 Tax=Plakobranchus ocellatus TaxID=259542 RepID=A0AAV3YJ14_9GAST|nr:transmembrane protein 120a-like [Plakobranchus ocellatus]
MGSTSQNLENLILSLGGKGKFQLTIQFLVAFVYTPLVFNHVIMAFHGSSIPHECMAAADMETGFNSTALTGQIYVMNVTHSECSSAVYYSNGQNKIIECTAGQWKYFPKYVEKNIVSKFDLVCSNEYLANLATTIYFIGVMIGGLLFGDLADRFGRLPVMLFTLYASMCVGLITAFSVNYIMFVCLRFVHGVLIQGLQTSAYTLLMELYRPKDRPFAGVMAEVFFSTSIMVLAGLAYLLRDWQHLQIAINLVPLLTLFYPWFVPESLRWLILRGKTEKAEKLLHRICKTNKIPYPEECWNLLKQDSRGQHQVVKQYNLSYLFRRWPIARLTFICFYLWFVVSLSYYGLTFKITSFKGNPYLNFFLSGLFETLTYLFSLLLMNRFGRKKPLWTCFAFASAMCLTSGFVNSFTTGLDSLVTAFALAGKSSVACVFAVLFVYVSELYPTVARNIGLGAGMFFARFGSVMAPQINQWTGHLLGIDGIFIFGSLSLAACVLVIPLPETHKKRLPDTFAEREIGEINTSDYNETSKSDSGMLELKNGAVQA